MIQITYSNRIEELLAALAERLAVRRAAGRSLFEPAHLVVPSRPLEAWVKQGLARALGIAAGLDVSFLRSFLGGIAARSFPDARLLDGAQLQGLLLALLHDDARLAADPRLEPVRAYLHAAGERADAVDLRRQQLAAELAHLYDEYGYSRPELLAAWRDGATVLDGTPCGAVERWQQRLWALLFGPGGVVEARAAENGRRWLTLPALYAGARVNELKLPDEVHVFGISHVAPAYHRVLHLLSEATALHIYTVNPCREFWEDLETDGERRRRLRRNGRGGARQLSLVLDEAPGAGAGEERETPALRLWGRPGRENVRLLDELAACSFDEHYRDPMADGASLLHQLQHDILVREPERTAPAPELDFSGDESVTILACPNVRRELETIATEIWRLVRCSDQAGGPPLRFSDIAVILPAGEEETYLVHVGSVFGEHRGIPHAVADLPLAATSRIIEAIELLLALPLGTFTRKEVLRLATHPAVMARWPEVDPVEWLAWCESLAVADGSDHADHAGTYIERDLYNWDQALRRLALGAVMAGRRSGDERPVELGGQRYLPEDYAPDALPSAMAFTLLVRSFIEDARFARAAKMRLADWIELLSGLVEVYVVATDSEEEAVRLRCLDAIRALDRIELGEQPVSYRIACELARAALAGLRGSRGRPLAEGVAVSSFESLRAIPFRVVFVAGLGEGLFPARDRRSELDLRQARRHPGDVSPREQDASLFLDTLLATRERLYLSYVARNPLTGEPCAPSSILAELTHLLEQGYLGVGGMAARTRRPPLRRHRDAAAVLTSPAAAGERRAAELGAMLRGPGQRLDLARLRETLAPEAWESLARVLRVVTPPAASAVESAPETLAVSLTAVRRFLECPLQGAARYRLHLREVEDEAVLDREDEPLSTGRPDEVTFLREVFSRGLARGGRFDREALTRALEELGEIRELDGTLPTGVFGQTQRAAHLEVLDGWRLQLGEVLGDTPLRSRTYRFGRAEEHAHVDEILPAISLDLPAPGGGRPLRVELIGKTELVLDAPSASVVLVRRSRVDRGKGAKDSLRGFLDQVALAAAGLRHEEHSVLLCMADGQKQRHVERWDFRGVDRDTARRYLGEVLADLVGHVHDYLLPCEAVFSLDEETFAGPGAGAAVRKRVCELRDEGFSGFSSLHGPIAAEDVRRLEPPDERQAGAMLARRFGLYFDRLTGAGR